MYNCRNCVIPKQDFGYQLYISNGYVKNVQGHKYSLQGEYYPFGEMGFFHLLRWVKKMAAVTPTPTGLALCVQYLTEMKRLSQRCVFIFVLGYMATALTGWYHLTSGFGSGCYESKTFRSMWHIHGKYWQGKEIGGLSEMWNGDNFLPPLLNMNSSYFQVPHPTLPVLLFNSKHI